MALSKTRPPLKRPRKRAGDLADAAFERLRQAILTGELKEGERVREVRLAAEWNVGITPLKAAVRRLAGIGYLVLRPNHAPVVRKLSADDIGQIYELREILECHALCNMASIIRKADLSALRKLVVKVDTAKTHTQRLRGQFTLDKKLHQLWSSGRTNPWLTASLDGLLLYRPNLVNVLKTQPALVETAFEEHKHILTALEKGEIEKAVQLLSEHIKKSGSALVALTQQASSHP
jgi:DNA-binding GntR family transcriptional regulator